MAFKYWVITHMIGKVGMDGVECQEASHGRERWVQKVTWDIEFSDYYARPIMDAKRAIFIFFTNTGDVLTGYTMLTTIFS